MAALGRPGRWRPRGLSLWSVRGGAWGRASSGTQMWLPHLPSSCFDSGWWGGGSRLGVRAGGCLGCSEEGCAPSSPSTQQGGSSVPHTFCQASDHILIVLPLEILPAQVQPRRLLFWEVSSETLSASESSPSWRLGGRRAGLSFTCIWGAAPEDQLLHWRCPWLHTLRARGGRVGRAA